MCIDFCAGNECVCAHNDQHRLKHPRNSLVGGNRRCKEKSLCKWQNLEEQSVSLVRNLGGRVKTYKENIYRKYGINVSSPADTDKEK